MAGCLLPQLVSAQFIPADADTARLNRIQTEQKYTQSISYLYLTTYYKAVSGKDSVLYYETDSKMICAFNQRFEKGIMYTVMGFKESASETMIFPKRSSGL